MHSRYDHGGLRRNDRAEYGRYGGLERCGTNHGESHMLLHKTLDVPLIHLPFAPRYLI